MSTSVNKKEIDEFINRIFNDLVLEMLPLFKKDSMISEDTLNFLEQIEASYHCALKECPNISMDHIIKYFQIIGMSSLNIADELMQLTVDAKDQVEREKQDQNNLLMMPGKNKSLFLGDKLKVSFIESSEEELRIYFKVHELMEKE